jgi:hypothetical protein
MIFFIQFFCEDKDPESCGFTAGLVIAVDCERKLTFFIDRDIGEILFS